MWNLRGLVAVFFVAFAGECLILAEGATDLHFTSMSEVRKRKALARKLQERLARRQKAHKALGLLKLSKAEQKVKDEKEMKAREVKDKQQQEHIQLQLLQQGRAQAAAPSTINLLARSSKVTAAAVASVSQASPMAGAKFANNLKHNVAFKVTAHRAQRRVWAQQKTNLSLAEETNAETRKLTLAKRTNGQATKQQWKMKLSKKFNEKKLFNSDNIRTNDNSLGSKRQKVFSRLKHRQEMMKRRHAR
eukprot:TRINITY_DN562_c0_g1_i2.p1 TRINITY_DN562_c0_g1~~TRINITY_DN562_c0_g1_i2.p1  ORF type:complete len:247 (-),score=58.59 TRINITY_DN562_c0_g1_i2:86-826(-)